MPRRELYAWIIPAILLVRSTGCMGIPNIYFHKYEGNVQGSPFYAIEDGRRVKLIRVNVKKNIDSWVGPSGTAFLAAATADRRDMSAEFPPPYTGGFQLNDQTLLKELLEHTPTNRDPVLLYRWLSTIQAPRPWTAGYVVSIRPAAIAFTSTVAMKSGPSDETISDLTFVTKRVFRVTVDTVQIADSDRSCRTVTLAIPMALEELLTSWDAEKGSLHNSVDLLTTRP